MYLDRMLQKHNERRYLRTIRAMRFSSSGSLFATPQFSMLLRGCSRACASLASPSSREEEEEEEEKEEEAVVSGVRRRKMAEHMSHTMAMNCSGDSV
jgi:hypothetical protein